MNNQKILGLPASAKDEASARASLEQIRWPDGPVCPTCGSLSSYRLTPKATSKSPGRQGLVKCKDCRKQFTVTVGTIFEGSHIPLHKWLMATHFLCSSKKGMSALQLQRMLGLTYKSAWFMAHRLREAMKQTPLKEKLTGVVEADETYIGGKEKNKHLNKRLTSGRGPKGKQIVIGAYERSGRVRTLTPPGPSKSEVHRFIRENVVVGSTLYTDEYRSYQGLKGYNHQRLNHSIGEYVRGNASTNGIESFWALLKRGVTGTFHHVSKQHLHRYCAEFEHRWNHRKTTDEERAIATLQQIEGKRLFYKQPIGGVEKPAQAE